MLYSQYIDIGGFSSMMSTFAGKNWVFTFFPLGPIQANVTIVLDKVRDVIAVFDAGHSDIRTILQVSHSK